MLRRPTEITRPSTLLPYPTRFRSEHGITPAGHDLKTLGVVILRNGEVAATAAGAAVLGSPLNSVALLANMLGKRDREIPAGTLVLTGGITEAVPIDRKSTRLNSRHSCAPRMPSSA